MMIAAEEVKTDTVKRVLDQLYERIQEAEEEVDSTGNERAEGYLFAYKEAAEIISKEFQFQHKLSFRDWLEQAVYPFTRRFSITLSQAASMFVEGIVSREVKGYKLYIDFSIRLASELQIDSFRLQPGDYYWTTEQERQPDFRP